MAGSAPANGYAAIQDTERIGPCLRCSEFLCYHKVILFILFNTLHNARIFLSISGGTYAVRELFVP